MILKFHVNNSIDKLSHVLHLLKYVISSSDFVYSSLYFYLQWYLQPASLKCTLPVIWNVKKIKTICVLCHTLENAK